MKSRQLMPFLLAVVVTLVAVVVSIGSFAASPALASGRAATEAASLDPLAEPLRADDLDVAVYFPSPVTVQVTDPGGNVVGEGVHVGALECVGIRCHYQTYLGLDTSSQELTVFEYAFDTRLALDPDAERVVVEGRGTILGRGQKERFSFTATFENNQDNTVFVAYVASRPGASFTISSVPGTFVISSRR